MKVKNKHSLAYTFPKASLNGDSTMERQNIKQQIDRYRQELRKAVHHPILNRSIGEVELDETKAFFLLLPLLNGEKWTDAMNAAAVAVGAVHVALDVHDVIERSDATSTQQQLKVLSGDYFSGVHYRILAALPEIGFIQELSKTIGQINETKTNFHDHSPNGSKELLETIQILEAGCIIRFLHSFGFSHYVPLASSILPLRLLDPRVGHTDPRPKIESTRGWQVQEKDAEQALFEVRTKMGEAINGADFLSPFLKEDICGMTTPLLGKMI